MTEEQETGAAAAASGVQRIIRCRILPIFKVVFLPQSDAHKMEHFSWEDLGFIHEQQPKSCVDLVNVSLFLPEMKVWLMFEYWQKSHSRMSSKCPQGKTNDLWKICKVPNWSFLLIVYEKSKLCFYELHVVVFMSFGLDFYFKMTFLSFGGPSKMTWWTKFSPQAMGLKYVS